MRKSVRLFILTMALAASATGTALAADDEAQLRGSCSWLERAIAREPARDDAIMMFMRGMRPKCGALLEGIARKDGSVTPKTIGGLVKEIEELRAVVDAEWKAAHPNEPDPAAGPSPAEKAAAEKAAADKAEAERLAAEKAAAERARLTEKERQAADRKAAEDAKRAEKERLAAEKRAAEQAEKERQAFEKAERERLAAEKRAADQSSKERQALERAEAERLAAEKVAAEQAEKERLALEREERAQLERDLAEAERLRREALSETPPPTTKPAGTRLDGTWEQPPTKVLDRNVKRTLNLISKGKSVEGELFEEVWYPAPVAWIDRSCGGNTTFRMVTTARVTGTVEGRELELRRDVPRILACTCASRCTVEDRRRGMAFEISASGQQLSDETGVFSRPGATAAVAGGGGGETGVAAPVVGPVPLAGVWETSPFSAQDRKVIWRLELEEKEGKLVGSLTERSSQALPLQSWSARFCDGADRWEWVTSWRTEAKVPKGRKVSLTAKDGAHLLCSCPSKCIAPDKKRVLELEIGPDGRSLTDGPRVFERK